MKLALAIMLALSGILLAMVIVRGQSGEAARAALTQAQHMIPILLVAIFMAGCIEVLLPKGLVQGWLSEAAGWRGIVIAWIGGALTPSGSIMGLPLAAGLARSGVGMPALITYLVSLSTLSILRMPIEIGILGTRMAMLRLVTCLLLPPLAGLLTRGILVLLRGAPQ